MRSTLRFSAVCALVVLAAVSTFGQQRPMVGTVVDVDTGHGRLQIELDDDSSSRVSIETDAVSTQYVGFGTMIAGKPEIFTGSKGFSNVRLGDRIELRGSPRAANVYTADTIRLLGRQVAAGSVGVGQTRSQTNASTPTDDRTTAQQSGGALEGTIRQINLDEGRLVIQNNQRRMITVRTYRNTPVYFRNETYRVSNLEIGDRVRIETDTRDAQTDEITAVRIDVTQSVRDSGTAPSTGSVVTVIAGRVARAEPGLDTAYVDDGRGEIRVDMSRARDERGDALHARDLRIGERVEISGSYNRAGDMFLASTVRPASVYMPDTDRTDRTPRVEDDFDLLSVVSISGTVTEILEEDGTNISVRDRNNRTVSIWLTGDFVVRLRGSGYTTAANLRVDDGVTIKAFRDSRGNFIAQTIRLRNR